MISSERVFQLETPNLNAVVGSARPGGPLGPDVDYFADPDAMNGLRKIPGCTGAGGTLAAPPFPNTKLPT